MKFNSIEIKKFNKELAKVEKNLTSFDISKEVENVLHEGGSDIRNTMSLSMQQTKKAPWYYPRGRKKHFPSLPGHPPAFDSGELLGSLMFDVNKFQLRVGVFGGAPYAKDLEKGKGKLKARPFLKPAVEKHEKEIIDKIGKIVPSTIEKGFE